MSLLKCQCVCSLCVCMPVVWMYAVYGECVVRMYTWYVYMCVKCVWGLCACVCVECGHLCLVCVVDNCVVCMHGSGIWCVWCVCDECGQLCGVWCVWWLWTSQVCRVCVQCVWCVWVTWEWPSSLTLQLEDGYFSTKHQLPVTRGPHSLLCLWAQGRRAMWPRLVCEAWRADIECQPLSHLWSCQVGGSQALAVLERNFQEALGSLEECQGTRAWWLLRGYLVQSMSSWGFQILVGSKIDLVDCKELFLKSKIEKGPLHSWEEVEVLGNFVSIVCVCVCAGLWCKIMYYHQL